MVERSDPGCTFQTWEHTHEGDRGSEGKHQWVNVTSQISNQSEKRFPIFKFRTNKKKFEYGAMHSVHSLFCAIAMMIVCVLIKQSTLFCAIAMMIVCVLIKVAKTLTLIN
jgi:hypothetical protein